MNKSKRQGEKTRRDSAGFAMTAWGPDIHMATMLYSSCSNMATMSKEFAQFRNWSRMWLVHSESGKIHHVLTFFASSQFLQQVEKFWTFTLSNRNPKPTDDQSLFSQQNPGEQQWDL